MKTKHLFHSALILIFALGIIFTGCQKEEEPEPEIENGSTTIQQLSADDNFQQEVSDEVDRDIEGVLSSASNRSIDWLPCNVTVDSADVVNDTITYFITYDGLNCIETLFRTGQVQIKKHVDTEWHKPGATVIVKFINLKVTRVFTGKSITINGVKTHENVTGGFLLQLGYAIDEIIHRTEGFMTIKFDDGANRTWNIARRLVYTGEFEAFVVAIDGFGTAGDYTNLVTWGVSREGDQFYISIPESVVFKQLCEWDPISGIESIDIPGEDTGATLTFGFDSNNQPIQGEECPAKYKVDWYQNGNSGTIFLWL